MFTFLTDPRIPPTNNGGERGLREPIVHRKVRGAIRSEETMGVDVQHIHLCHDDEEPGREKCSGIHHGAYQVILGIFQAGSCQIVFFEN